MILKAQSRSNPNIVYDIDTEKGTCTCPDFVFRAQKSMTRTYICKHIRDLAHIYPSQFSDEILTLATPQRHIDATAEAIARVLSWADGEYSVSKKDGEVFALHGGDGLFQLGRWYTHLLLYNVRMGDVVLDDDEHQYCELKGVGAVRHVPRREFPYAKIFQLLDGDEICELINRYCQRGIELTPRGLCGADLSFSESEDILKFVGLRSNNLWNWYSGRGRDRQVGMAVS
jgi:hypothetical protein